MGKKYLQFVCWGKYRTQNKRYKNFKKPVPIKKVTDIGTGKSS